MEIIQAHGPVPVSVSVPLSEPVPVSVPVPGIGDVGPAVDPHHRSAADPGLPHPRRTVASDGPATT
jgi:hypothetical protein